MTCDDMLGDRPRLGIAIVRISGEVNEVVRHCTDEGGTAAVAVRQRAVTARWFEASTPEAKLEPPANHGADDARRCAALRISREGRGEL